MKAKIIPIRPLKLGPTQFKAEVERLQAEGRMPSLPELLDVIAETRKMFVHRIRRCGAKEPRWKRRPVGL
jgi:hypothetical protein